MCHKEDAIAVLMAKMQRFGFLPGHRSVRRSVTRYQDRATH
jgi:hypothetical protein